MFGLHFPRHAKVTGAVVASLMLLIASSYAQSTSQGSKCVNGYRSIVRDTSPNDSPGQDTIVVRCR